MTVYMQALVMFFIVSTIVALLLILLAYSVNKEKINKSFQRPQACYWTYVGLDRGLMIVDMMSRHYKNRDLCPTGRWKLEQCDDDSWSMYVEHDCPTTMKQWIHENRIEFYTESELEEPIIYINGG